MKRTMYEKNIGKSLLEYLDFDDSHKYRKGNNINTMDMHYIETVLAEKASANNLNELINSVRAHPMLEDKVHESSIKAELLEIMRIDTVLKEMKTWSEEKLGKYLVAQLMKNYDKRLVIFPLHDMLPTFRETVFGRAIFNTFGNILGKFNIKPVTIEDAKLKPHRYDDYKLESYLFEQNNYNRICVAMCIECCDNEIAIKKAEHYINQCINSIRLIIPVYYGLHNRPEIGIHKIEVFEDAYVIDLNKAHRKVMYDQMLIKSPLIFGVGNLKHKLDRIYTYADSLLKRYPDEITEFEIRLLKAVTWCGEAIADIEKETKVIKSVIALEVLFCIGYNRKQINFIKSVMKLTVGFKINANIIKKRTKRMYTIRSAIMHEGRREITDDDVLWAEKIACCCIFRTFELACNFNNCQEFKEWLGITNNKIGFWGYVVNSIARIRKLLGCKE